MTAKLLQRWCGGPLAPFLAIAALLSLLVVLGHEGRRVGQVLFLALPGLACLFWPLRNARAKALRAAALWLCIDDLRGRCGAARLPVRHLRNRARQFAATQRDGYRTAQQCPYLATHWRSIVSACLPMPAAGLLLLAFIWPVGGRPDPASEHAAHQLSHGLGWPSCCYDSACPTASRRPRRYRTCKRRRRCYWSCPPASIATTWAFNATRARHHSAAVGPARRLG